MEAGFSAMKIYGIEIPLHPSDELATQIKDETLAAQKKKTET